MSKELTPEEQSTVDSYDANASAWAGSHATQDFWSKETVAFQRYLPKGRVLELGSGGGRDAKTLIALGYDYTGTDISEGLLELATANNPGATFLHQSVYDLDFPDNTFDGFWASAVLLHVPKDRIDEALQRIKKVVKPEGVGFISIKQGEGEKVLEEDRGSEGLFKRFFAFYSQPEFNQVLDRNGYKVVESDIQPPEGNTIWMTYIVKVIK